MSSINTFKATSNEASDPKILSRVATAHLKKRKKRTRMLRIIGIILYFFFAVAISYYTKEYLTRERGTYLYLIGLIVRTIVSTGFMLLIYYSFQKRT
ncbi:hypothetical protein [Alkalicoccobacillus murimartini]|uniref:Uncharacterized protein n=1 Tax=Alkalicoccobacillus murimartini TaxID=171685 RepID=A0ABT9YC11_9BACI|nr:hypothetical protein [Alkalicoccobacillus murimartini]MDQ0205384.1 hypothetical protein [Alkalicoccobacillus murimartini]